MNNLIALLSDDTKCRSHKASDLELQILSTKSSIDLGQLMALLKEKLQNWSKCGGSKDNNGYSIVVLCQLILSLASNKKWCPTLLTDDQLKAVIYAISYSIRMTEVRFMNDL